MASSTQDISLKESIENDITMTCSNYTKMHSRLQLRNNMASILIVYYSILSIILGLINRYFTISELADSVLDFSAILTTIIILVSSLMISLANYSTRIQRAVSAIDKLKKMKKEIKALSGGMDEESYKKRIIEYHSIIDQMELRSDIDFYRTCIQKKKTEDYFTGLQKFVLSCEIIIERLFYLCLIVGPIILIVVVVRL